MKFDYTAIDQPVSAADVAAYRSSFTLPMSVANVQIAGFVALVAFAAAFTLTGLIFLISSMPGAAVYAGTMLAFAALFIGGLLLASWYYGKMFKKSVKLWKFAAANGFTYVPKTKEPGYNGMMFSQGYDRASYDQLFKKVGKGGFEFGSYSYTTGSGKNRRTHTISYIGIVLERNLPQIVLDSNANNARGFGLNVSNLPVYFHKDQALKLEGDFNKYFTLYAPKDYERDALYIFTPDLMALFIDNVAALDAEIVDNKLYVYSNAMLDFSDKKILDRVAAIVSVVGGKVLSQTDRYADANVGDRSQNIVAPSGRRLRRGISWFAIVVIVLIFAVNVVPAVMDAIGYFK